MNNERNCSCGSNNNDAAHLGNASVNGCGCADAVRDAVRDIIEERESSCCRCSRGNRGSSRSGERTGFFCCLNRLFGGEGRSANGCGCQRERRSSCGCSRRY